jgi:hypothetical protein
MLHVLIAILLTTLSTAIVGSYVLSWCIDEGDSSTQGSKRVIVPILPLFCVVGLAANTTVLAWLSLIIPLGNAYGAGLFGISLLPIFITKVRRLLWASLIGQKKITLYIWGASILLIGISAVLKATGPTEIFDDAVAYLPIFRSILDYGLVIGLGNLHPNFAYNSHWSLAGAFYSYEWLFGQAEYDINAWVAIVGVAYSGYFIARLWEGQMRPIIVLLAFLPYFYFRNQMSGNSTDLPTAIFSWLVLGEWLLGKTLIQTNLVGGGIISASNKRLNALLFIALPLFIFTMKVTALSLLFLPVVLLFRFLVEPKTPTAYYWRIAIISGVVVLAPWFIRNVYLTGYLYFLAPKLDLFALDWKMPLNVLARLTEQIAGDVHHSPKQASLQWLTRWLKEGFNPSSLVILFAGLGGGALLAFAAFVNYPKMRTYVSNYRTITVAASLVFGWLFWFSAATEPRYGHTVLTMLALLLPSIAICAIPDTFKKVGSKIIVSVFLSVLGFSTYKSNKEFPSGYPQLLYSPAPYPEVTWQNIQGKNFIAHFPIKFVSSFEDRLRFFPAHTAARERFPQCWLTPMPCIYRREDIPLLEQRGPSPRDGYRYITTPN